MPQATAKLEFQRDTVLVNGIPVVLLSAGSGPPLLHMHGAGTWHGFDFALPWAKHHRLLIPIHPGWPESGEAEWMTSIHDYVMHYLELIDHLGLPQIDLVGLSMGGRMAAAFASEHRRRVRKLVLVAPAGLNVPGYEIPDFSKIPPQEIIGYLTENVPLIAQRAPAIPPPEWLAARERESASFGRLLADIMNPGFTRWLHRVTMPSLLVWGEKDRITPIQQAPEWRRWIPGVQFRSVVGAGHLVLDERPEIVEEIGRFFTS